MARKCHGPIRVAEISPSRGERLFKRRHNGHQPLAIFSGQGQSSARKVVRMYQHLQESGWSFRFKAEAKSPRGFIYSAEGGSPLEAFLKAFGQWHSDVASFLPKIPEILNGVVKPDIKRPEASPPVLKSAGAPRVSPFSPEIQEKLRSLYRKGSLAEYGRVRCRLARHPDMSFEQALRWKHLSVADRFDPLDYPETKLSSARILPTKDPVLARKRTFLRLYMRQYRARRRVEAAA